MKSFLNIVLDIAALTEHSPSFILIKNDGRVQLHLASDRGTTKRAAITSTSCGSSWLAIDGWTLRWTWKFFHDSRQDMSPSAKFLDSDDLSDTLRQGFGSLTRPATTVLGEGLSVFWMKSQLPLAPFVVQIRACDSSSRVIGSSIRTSKSSRLASSWPNLNEVNCPLRL